MPSPSTLCTAFAGDRRLASGPLAEVVRVLKPVIDAGEGESILVFDDATSHTLEIDFRGSLADVLGRLPPPAADAGESAAAGAPRKAGRPKLGVVGREITLLPRQWEWLAAQPGGASVVLRRLVDEAKKDRDFKQLKRDIQATTYRFMSTIAGDRPGFEEAARALFANDRERLEMRIAQWPADIRAHTLFLARGGAIGVADPS